MSRGTIREVGPHPLMRAIVALFTGLVVGAVVALLIPRERGPAASLSPDQAG